ncbi:MAG: DUF2179 domain-containing protein [Desulfovibrionaceae bacterium]|jgi:uncharacterized protein YebE (UPF0316 family)|nr:DUF2179 domain-containing protein [Desulfovibrionaceae bacterium]
MHHLLDPAVLLTGLAVFLARVTDVTLGTIRTISLVHGRMAVAFALGLVEITIWVVVMSAVVARLPAEPVLAVFYALGFASGNVLGIALERRLALGSVILRVISRTRPADMAAAIRGQGHGVTTFQGAGLEGPVTELYIVCRRRCLPAILRTVRALEPDAFCVAEPTADAAAGLSAPRRAAPAEPTGWRAVLKRK